VTFQAPTDPVVEPHNGKGQSGLDLVPPATKSLSSKAIPVTSFDSTLNSIFSASTSIAIGERFVVAIATHEEVMETIASLRDLFEVTDQSQASALLGELLVIFGDNSTSPQTPYRFLYSFNGRTFAMSKIISCFRPDPRRFWRTLADVTRSFLRQHPEVTFKWADLHGFPPTFREFGFDTADFCSDIPADARKAIQAAKDAALNRSTYNLMRADLKAVGSGAGTIVEQQAGSVFNKRRVG